MIQLHSCGHSWELPVNRGASRIARCFYRCQLSFEHGFTVDASLQALAGQDEEFDFRQAFQAGL
ncbi:MAG: hypothetical protein HY268_03210 [Deltaproteobacteria bacterium]|nr:hypothetical protein [Deltaproteobacteria bacterium]